MHGGNQCIELTEDGSWETFAPFAERFVAQLGGTIVDRLDGPDVRLWTVRIGEHILRLVYDDYPNGISLEPLDASSQILIWELFERFRAESSPDGL